MIREMDRETVASERERGRLQRANSLDRDALGAIYDEYHQPMYSYIFRRVGDVETARDLTAEIFRRLLQAIQGGSGPRDNLRAWLYRVAHNIIVDHYRRQGNRQLCPLEEDWVAAGANPSKEVEQRIQLDRVRVALTRLTPDQQQVVALKFLEGMSNKEVAEITGKPVGAIKSLQHRALASLQRQLIPSEEEVPT